MPDWKDRYIKRLEDEAGALFTAVLEKLEGHIAPAKRKVVELERKITEIEARLIEIETASETGV